MTTAFRKQNTIARPATVSGFGYWSSLDVTVEFRPASENSGIVFVRRDDAELKRIPALIALRENAPRRTSLANSGATVDMVEHIMAALAGLQIDNCEVWVNRAEMPGCDGSSLAFVEALCTAGVVQQNEYRSKLIVQHVLEVGNDENWIRAEPNAAGEFKIDFHLDYPLHPVIGQQDFSIAISRDSFVEHLAPARTFVLKHEAEYLNRMGLGRRATARDLIVFDENGPIDNRLRFDNECVRHKTLDVLGDFALAPFDIVGTFSANRSGHKLNAEMVERLLQEATIARPSDVHGIKKSA